MVIEGELSQLHFVGFLLRHDYYDVRYDYEESSLSRTDHFFFFLGFLIFKLASGMGIRSPSSAGSVIFTIFLTILIPLAKSLTSLSFS